MRIFNRDFIDANLQQADYTHAPALFIVGEDNIRLSNRIVSLSRRRDRVAAMYRSVQTKQSETRTAREKAARRSHLSWRCDDQSRRARPSNA